MNDERIERPLGSSIFAVLYVLLGLLNLLQAIPHLLRPEFADATTLYWLQCAAGVVSLATGAGAWLRRGWSAWTALAWGAIMAATVLLVPVELLLPPVSHAGFYEAAVVLLAFGALSAWYLWRKRASAVAGDHAGAAR